MTDGLEDNYFSILQISFLHSVRFIFEQFVLNFFICIKNSLNALQNKKLLLCKFIIIIKTKESIKKYLDVLLDDKSTL
jgi:hypothetical protein